MVYQKLNAYRVPINVSILDGTAEKIIQEAKNPESLLDALGWGNEHLDFVKAGSPPVKDHKKIVQLIKDYHLRNKLKEARIARGYPTLVSPRNGLQGWIQRKFRDPKENKLPITLDILIWLRSLPRYQLLMAVHDALLAQVSSAEPRRVGQDHLMNEFVHPVAEMIRDKDANRVERLRQALASPLHGVSPGSLVDDFSGYVISYDRNHGVAYYYGA
jgi:hypothetical protein